MAMRNIEEPTYWAPLRKAGRGWLVFKDSPAAPQAPDPTKTANAQTNSNIDTANASAAISNTNQVTPWGNLTYTKTGGDTFDQAGYDAAQADYNQRYASYNKNMSKDEADRATQGDSYVPQGPWVAPTAVDRSTYEHAAPDHYTANVTLSPSQQALLDAQTKDSLALSQTGNGLLGSVNSAMGTPLSYAGLPQVNNGGLQYGAGYGQIQNDNDMSGVPSLVGGDQLYGAMKQAQDASYNQAQSRLDPQWNNQQHDLENQLTQQGIMQNSDAWNRATESFGRNRNDAYQTARNNAVGEGNNAEAQLYGQGLSSNQNAYGQASNNMTLHNAAQNQGYGQALSNAQLANQAAGQEFSQSMAQRNQGINELMAQRENPLNELNALRTGSQVTSPTFVNAAQGNVAPTNTAGIAQNAYQGQLGLYNSGVASNNSTTGAVASVASAAAMAAAVF